MEGRKSWLWAAPLLLCAGCLTSSSQKTGQGAGLAQSGKGATAAADFPAEASSKKDAKRTPRLILAYANFKEGEAKSLSRNPEQQFKLRDQARVLYQEAIKGDPSLIDAHRGLGRVYVDLGDFDRAQEIFTKAQARFPRESIFWFELGQMHNRKKDFATASRCLNKALEIDPENRLYLTTLGFTLARAGRSDESLALLTRSMGAASAHFNVARMLLHLERTDEGVQHLRQAVQANPHLDGAHQLLSELDNGNRRANVTLQFQAGE